MKILHIKKQLSKKNYSISSLIIYISSIKSFTKKDISIAISKFEKKFFRISKDVSIISVNNWVNFFFSKLNKFNFFHLLVIWSLLQILTVLFCVNKKTNVFVHPHGMLLHDALKSEVGLPYFKTDFPRYSVFFFQRVNFIAITNQEKEAIRYFFKKSKIFLF